MVTLLKLKLEVQDNTGCSSRRFCLKTCESFLHSHLQIVLLRLSLSLSFSDAAVMSPAKRPVCGSVRCNSPAHESTLSLVNQRDTSTVTLLPVSHVVSIFNCQPSIDMCETLTHSLTNTLYLHRRFTVFSCHCLESLEDYSHSISSVVALF